MTGPGGDVDVQRGPIVVLGPGRSGTTLLARAIGEHPDLAWFSGANNRWPTQPALSLTSRVAQLPGAAALRKRVPYFPTPGETYGVWDAYFPGFSTADRDWTPADVSDAAVARFRAFVADVCRWQGRRRFMTKITGWPRVELLRHVLPGVWLVHIDRDPRAVVASWIKQGWFGFKRDRDAQRSLGTTELVALYGDHYLARWRAFQPHRDAPGVLALRYEDLCARFQPTLVEVCTTVGLRAERQFEEALGRIVVAPALDEWREQVSDEVAALLTEWLAEPIEAGGYG